jgi:hypothetical protein
MPVTVPAATASLVADGFQDGSVFVADNTHFYTGQLAAMTNKKGTLSKLVRILVKDGTTGMVVGDPVGGSPLDVSAFKYVDRATISMPSTTVPVAQDYSSDPLAQFKFDGHLRSVTGLSSSTVLAQNLNGTVTINATGTTATVTFAIPEPNANYRINLSAGVGSGAPGAAALNPSWATKTTTGFVINLGAAVAAAASVVVDWFISR